MVVCKYFLQGNCKFGDSCKNEHPGASSGGFSNQNRYGPFSNSGANIGGSNNARRDSPWSINTTDIKNDLTAGKGRPQWILSTYGPGRQPPASLLEGNEYSFEELRVRFYELAKNGQQDQANQEASALWSKAQQAIIEVTNNVDKVASFMEDAEKKHPNRPDFCKIDGTRPLEQALQLAVSNADTLSVPVQQSGSGLSSQPSAFGKPSGAFGQPASSTFGKPSTGFRQPSFGQTSSPAFGQPSKSTTAFGQPSTSAFGKPATGFGQPAFGQSSAPALGQLSKPSASFGQPAQTSGFGSTGFGKPSALGANAAFGAPSTTSGFGQPAQPSAFGQPAKPSSGFGQPTTSTAFGVSSQSGPTFGKPALQASSSAFGQLSQATSAFGQPAQPGTTFGKPAQPASVFGQPAKPGLAFGQAAQPAAFGQPSQPSAFGQPAATRSAFGTTPAPAFGATSAPASGTSTSPAFGAASAPAFGASSAPAFGTTSSPAFGKPPVPAFGAPAAPSSPFGQPSTSQPGNGFGVKPGQTSTGFGQAAQPSPAPAFGAASSQAPVTSSAGSALPANTSGGPHPLTGKPSHPLHYTETLPTTNPTLNPSTRKLATYRGRRVDYVDDKMACYERPDGKGLEQIWFPQPGGGDDVQHLGKKPEDLLGETGKYTDTLIEQFRTLFDTGGFMNGLLPSVPPKREWVLYDF